MGKIGIESDCKDKNQSIGWSLYPVVGDSRWSKKPNINEGGKASPSFTFFYYFWVSTI